jgi:hypothetical protein
MRGSCDGGPDWAGAEHRRTGRLHPRPPAATQRERYEQELREATEQALATSDYGPLGNVVERWWRAARLEDRGGESWQRQQRLVEEGRWDELFPGPGRDVEELLR